MRSSLAVCLLLLPVLLTSARATEPEGRISGIVLNDEGQPVEHARVCTIVYLGRGATTACRVFSDGNGRFEIDHWPMSTLSLFAVKPEDGYGDAERKLTPRVTITPETPFAVVTVRLKPKAGILSGSVHDKVTGKVVGNITLRYITPDGFNTGSFSDLNGAGFEAHIPMATDLIVSLSAPGYKTWFYTDPSNESRPVLHLQSGERKSVEIELEPETAAAPTKQ